MASGLKLFIGTGIVLTALIGGSRALFHGEHKHVLINKKDIKDNKYMFYTSEGVFEDVDSWKNFKWNSSDVYNKIEEHKSYDLKTWGWRLPLFSSYPNIIGYEECKDTLPQAAPQ